MFARVLLLIALVSLWLAAAPASANTRYASPTGSDTASCADVAHACSVLTAVNGRGTNKPVANDEVVLEPGSYPLSAPLHPPVAGLSIHGTAPLGVNGVYTYVNFPGAQAVALNAVRANVSDLYISGRIIDPNATLERLWIDAGAVPAGQVECSCTDGTLRDSVVRGSSVTVGGLVGFVGPTAVAPHVGPITEDYRNDTIVTDHAANPAILIDHTTASVPVEFTAENLIVATWAPAGQGQGQAISVQQALAGQTTSLTITHSDIAGSATATGGANAITDPSDIAVWPPFASFSLGLNVPATSPTVDVGLNDPLNGALDMAGNPRTQGAATDMGAYETAHITTSPAQTPVNTGPGPGLFAKPKLKLYDASVVIDNHTLTGADFAKCTGVTVKCVVKGTLRATLPHHQTKSKVGTISGTLTPGKKQSLKLKMTLAEFDALEHRTGMKQNLSASITTTAGVTSTKQSFTIQVHTEPDFTRKPKRQ